MTVTASDASLSATAPVTINLSNVNEAPTFGAASYTFSVAENSASGASVGSVSATDPDAGTTLTYSLSGTGSSNFTINPSTGAITVAAGATLDFETTPSFSLTVTVTDNGSPVASATAPVTISLTNVNEAPAFTSGTTASVAENSTGTAYAAVAVDPDAGTTLTYSLSGTDAGLFDINSATGAVSFKASPDFEVPADAGANNVYDIVVAASDGTNQATRSVAITVTNVNEAPTLTLNRTITAVSGQTVQLGHALLRFTDPENATLTYTVTSAPVTGAIRRTMLLSLHSPALTWPLPILWQVQFVTLPVVRRVLLTASR